VNIRIAPYLAIIRNELHSTLKPARDDSDARQAALYIDRLLIQLQITLEVLPRLQREALREIDGFLDELCAAVRAIDGGIVLASELTDRVRVRADFNALESTLDRTVHTLLSRPGADSNRLVQRIANVISNLREALDRAACEMEQQKAAANARTSPPLDADQIQRLQAWLRKRFSGEETVEVGAITQLVGGGSKKTLLVLLRHARELPGEIVLRIDQSSGVLQTTSVDEFHVLDIVHGAGVPVPRPFAMESDASVLGAPFIMLSRIVGRNIGDHIECYEPGRAFALSLARALGTLHAIPPQRFGDRIPGATAATIDRVREHVDTLEASWRNSGEPAVALELSFAWLRTHMHLAEGRRSLIHCDVGCHNMLAHEGELSGLLDWETIAIGNPAHDLAYVYPLAVQMIAWEEFIAEYVRAGGVAPSAGEFDFYRVWTSTWRLPITFVAHSFLNAGFSTVLVHTYAAHHISHTFNRDLLRLMRDICARYA
jgi:aminoglycoside phosphotransferase (APT) family kinase protein